MTKDGLDVKLEMGDWVLAKSNFSKLHFLYHRCSFSSDDFPDYQKATYLRAEFPTKARHPDPRWACSWCLESPPEELEGLYLMLESEHTYAIMQQYTKTP